MKKILASFVVLFCFLIEPTLSLAQGIHPAFDPNTLIPDTVFNDSKALGSASGIQQFLESKGSVLANTSTSFVLKLHEPDDSFLKGNLDDPHATQSKPRTAAQLIWDVSQSTGINPQVILVTLNKEQSLITGKFSDDRLQRALDHSMGFACPDSGGCDGDLEGFYFQLFGNVDTEGNRYLGAAKSLMRSFNTTNGRGPQVKGSAAKVGDLIVLENTLGGFEGVQQKQNVKIGNRATAALYRYTPHVFNGNYNFWRFFTEWFSYPNGTVLKSTETGVYYLLEKGKRRQLPAFVAAARKISIAKTVLASATELQKYPLGELYTPRNNTIVKSGSAYYVFINNTKHLASRFVLGQRKLNVAGAVDISSSDAALFADGEMLIPANGTVLRAKTSKKTFLVQNGALKLFSPFTLKQYAVSAKIKIVPDAEIALYSQAGLVPPKNGTLVKSSVKGQIFIVQKGQKLPLSSQLFNNLGYKRTDVSKISEAEIVALPIGTAPTPKNNTYFWDAKTKLYYAYIGGAVHRITPALAKKHGLTTKYTFDTETIMSWKQGDPITK